MNKEQTVKAKHKLNGSVVEFDLVATALKRQKEGETPKYYPWFKSEQEKYSELTKIFGSEMLEELAVDAIRTKFQSFYFRTTADEKQVYRTDKDGNKIPVLKDGQPAKTDKGEVVYQFDNVLVPNLQSFLEAIEDEKLSAREITVDSCARKVASLMKEGNAVEAMKWMSKMQELVAAKAAEVTATATTTATT